MHPTNGHRMMKRDDVEAIVLEKQQEQTDKAWGMGRAVKRLLHQAAVKMEQAGPHEMGEYSLPQVVAIAEKLQAVLEQHEQRMEQAGQVQELDWEAVQQHEQQLHELGMRDGWSSCNCDGCKARLKAKPPTINSLARVGHG